MKSEEWVGEMESTEMNTEVSLIYPVVRREGKLESGEVFVCLYSLNNKVSKRRKDIGVL